MRGGAASERTRVIALIEEGSQPENRGPAPSVAAAVLDHLEANGGAGPVRASRRVPAGEPAHRQRPGHRLGRRRRAWSPTDGTPAYNDVALALVRAAGYPAPAIAGTVVITGGPTPDGDTLGLTEQQIAALTCLTDPAVTDPVQAATRATDELSGAG